MQKLTQVAILLIFLFGLSHNAEAQGRLIAGRHLAAMHSALAVGVLKISAPELKNTLADQSYCAWLIPPDKRPSPANASKLVWLIYKYDNVSTDPSAVEIQSDDDYQHLWDFVTSGIYKNALALSASTSSASDSKIIADLTTFSNLFAL